MHKVSIVVPIFKTEEKLLRDCITSLISQTLEDIEIFLIDDGSPDQCGQICDEYALKDKRIKVIHKVNEGVSVARNVGIEKSDSEYISFADADDWIDKETMEVAYSEAKLNDVDILQWTYIWHCGNRTVGDNHVLAHSGILNAAEKEEMVIKAIIDFHPSFSVNKGFAAGAPWAKLYKKDFLIRNNLRFVPGLTRSQDRVFNLFAYDVAEKIEYLDLPMSHYVANDTSAVVSYRPNVEKVYGLYLEKIQEFVSCKEKKNDVLIEAYNICVCYVIQQIFVQYLFNKKCRLSLKNKYREVKRISTDSLYYDGISHIEEITASLTKKQVIVCKLLKKKMCGIATAVMEFNRLIS